MLHANINNYENYSNSLIEYATNIKKPIFHKMKTKDMVKNYVADEILEKLELEICYEFFKFENEALKNFIQFLK